MGLCRLELKLSSAVNRIPFYYSGEGMGEPGGGSASFELTDQNQILLLDQNGVQLTDEKGP